MAIVEQPNKYGLLQTRYITAIIFQSVRLPSQLSDCRVQYNGEHSSIVHKAPPHYLHFGVTAAHTQTTVHFHHMMGPYFMIPCLMMMLGTSCSKS